MKQRRHFDPMRPKTSLRRFKEPVIKMAIRGFIRNKDGNRTGNYTAYLHVRSCIAALRRG